MKRTFLALGLFIGLLTQIHAQKLPLAIEFEATGISGYDASIPKPEAVIGHVVGSYHTRPDQVVAYFQKLASMSDRMVLKEHATSFENRPLVHAIVTSPENHARLEEIRKANLQLSDSPASVSDVALSQMPVIVYQGFSIHGNEASGTEASLVYLYHLIAGQGEGVEKLLQNAVFIIDPLFNPDGRDRFVDWVNRYKGGVATSDPQDYEHNEAWPGGRTNHYWFDLNRDWLPAQMPESEGRIVNIFHHWRPQLLTDHHEMGGDATFFFQPGIPSRNNPNTPESTIRLTEELATYHASELNRIGSLYYSEESFDDFYYGKGSTFPDINGAIGILFEQASSRALKTEVVDGTLHYAFTVRNQLAAAISSATGAVAMRQKFLKHMRDFYKEAPEIARQNAVKAYVLDADQYPNRAQLLAQMLLKHRIELYELATDFQDNGRSFHAGKGYVIPMNQPQVRLLKGIMEKMTTFQDSLFYDVSSWTMPLAFGVPYAEVNREPRGLIGRRIDSLELSGGVLEGGRASYAYLMEWGTYFAPRALYKILQMGIYPAVAKDPFQIEIGGTTKSFPRGTIVIPLEARDQHHAPTKEQIHALMQQIVKDDFVNIHAVNTGLTPMGPDLGSRSYDVLHIPKIALLVGSGINSNDSGEIWHLLTERFRIPISLIEMENLGRMNLTRYSTIITTSGINGSGADSIKEWIRSGGTLITTEQGSSWAIRSGVLNEKLKSVDTNPTNLPYAEISNTLGAQLVAGTIFESKLDTTHPLAFGYDEKVATFRTSNTYIEPSEALGANVGTYTQAPLMSGYISKEQYGAIKGTTSLLARRSGRGSVIIFADNPAFRAFWFGTNGLLMNAIFFGKSF